MSAALAMWPDCTARPPVPARARGRWRTPSRGWCRARHRTLRGLPTAPSAKRERRNEAMSSEGQAPAAYTTVGVRISPCSVTTLPTAPARVVTPCTAHSRRRLAPWDTAARANASVVFSGSAWSSPGVCMPPTQAPARPGTTVSRSRARRRRVSSPNSRRPPWSRPFTVTSKDNAQRAGLTRPGPSQPSGILPSPRTRYPDVGRETASDASIFLPSLLPGIPDACYSSWRARTRLLRLRIIREEAIRCVPISSPNC